jgi:hypothetical protein
MRRRPGEKQAINLRSLSNSDQAESASQQLPLFPLNVHCGHPVRRAQAARFRTDDTRLRRSAALPAKHIEALHNP